MLKHKILGIILMNALSQSIKVNFETYLELKEGGVLVHCAAGVSRV